MSLRFRVALAASVSVGLVLVVVGVSLVALVERDQRRAVDERLTEQARSLERPTVVRALLRAGRADAGAAVGSGGVVRLVADDGTVLVEAGAVPDAPFPPLGDRGRSTEEIDGEPWRVLTVPVPLAGPGTVGQVATPLSDDEAALASLRRRLAGLSVLGFVGAATGGWALGGRALDPLARLRTAAAEVADDADASRRVPASTGATEVDGLAGTLNEMLARLQEAIGGERTAASSAREFAANAAHELRTPMTALSANLDVLTRHDLDPTVGAEVLDDLRSDARRLAGVLGALEQLARGELHPASAAQPVELADLLDAAVADARRRHPEASFHLDDGGADEPLPPIVGWPEGLRVLSDNLLDNAARHGRPAPSEPADVGVSVAAVRDGVALTVVDRGPGIPPSERSSVLERFVRGSGAAVAGSGLGLALVEQQVRLHGGRLRIDDADGGGCRMTVLLPRSAT